MNRKRVFLLVLVFIPLYMFLYSKEIQVAGIIETVRKDGYVTVLCESSLTEPEYSVYSGKDRLIGKIISPERIGDTRSGIRYMARFIPLGNVQESLLRPGVRLVIVIPEREFDKALVPEGFRRKTEYRERIITSIDGREMALVPEGKFFMGSSYGDKDESPEQEVYLPDYYIDIYEVTNSEYKAFTDSTGTIAPSYWKDYRGKDGAFNDLYFSRLPVIVSYHEAVKYAHWAGKRLPDEKEWEKAARPPSGIDRPGQDAVYTWGYGFRDGISNTAELWLDEKTGENPKAAAKEKYGLSVIVKGYLPVDVYEPAAVSYYGCVHINGNAQEWTDSWYRAYNGNYVKDKKFGTQYKVIRGGAYFTTRKESRVTDRKTGGVPDLYTDRIAGFRCVKNAESIDRK